MPSIIATTTSALLAAQQRVSNAANNIANADSRDFKAQDVVQRAEVGGTVRAELVDRDPSTVTTISPEGLAQVVPNVSLDQELVTAQLATYDFKANATVLKTEQDLQKRLFDIFA